MAFTVTQAETLIYERVRDSAGTQHADVILPLMSDIQRLINACYGPVMVDGTLTGVAGQSFYSYSSIASDVVRPIQVSLDGRPLRRTDWRQLSAFDSRWSHAIGTPRVWDLYGHKLLVISPTKNSITFDVRYIQELADLTAGGSFAIPDPYITLLIDMTCDILLLRTRLPLGRNESGAAIADHSSPKVVE